MSERQYCQESSIDGSCIEHGGVCKNTEQAERMQMTQRRLARIWRYLVEYKTPDNGQVVMSDLWAVTSELQKSQAALREAQRLISGITNTGGQVGATMGFVSTVIAAALLPEGEKANQ